MEWKGREEEEEGERGGRKERRKGGQGVRERRGGTKGGKETRKRREEEGEEEGGQGVRGEVDLLSVINKTSHRVLTDQQVCKCLSQDLVKERLCGVGCVAEEVDHKEILTAAVVHQGKENTAKQTFVRILEGYEDVCEGVKVHVWV